MRSEMKVLLGKMLLVLAPFGGILGWYVLEDPFKVIFTYDSYIASGENSYVFVNRDFLGIENYMHRKDTVPYDAFIFGNSRATYFEVEDWLSHIGPARPYHMDASGEGIYGIWKKVIYLDTAAHAIRHALFVIDPGLLNMDYNPSSHITRKHPILSGEPNVWFQMLFFKVFLHHSFFWAYIDLTWSGQFKPYMAEDGIFDDYILHYDAATNEQTLQHFEEQIATDTISYYASRMHYFYERDSNHLVVYTPMIQKSQKEMLQEIASVLKRHQTQFHFLISPLYEAMPIHAEDVHWLKQTFGAERVHDFSGWNEYTRNYLNYYEDSHYRPHVAKSMMDRVYGIAQPAISDSFMPSTNAIP